MCLYLVRESVQWFTVWLMAWEQLLLKVPQIRHLTVVFPSSSGLGPQDKRSKIFLHCSIVWVILNPRPPELKTASAGKSLELPKLPFSQWREKRSPDSTFVLLLNTIKLQAANPDLAVTYKTTSFPSPAAVCAPDTRCWGRTSLHCPLHLPLWHKALSPPVQDWSYIHTIAHF